MRLKRKHFAIKMKNSLGQECFVTVNGHIVPYTKINKYIKRFLTREDAAEELRHEDEVIVDLRNEK